MATTVKKMNLYQKLVEVRRRIEGFGKDTAGHGYNYVSGSQIARKIKDTMDELQLLLIPSIDHESVKHEIFEYTTTKYDSYSKKNVVKEHKDFVVHGKMMYQWINAEEPNEKHDVEWTFYGQQNEASKALGSGLTYSERYFLLKFFGVPTDEDDPDAKDTTKNNKSNNFNKTNTKVGTKTNAANKVNMVNKTNAAINKVDTEKNQNNVRDLEQSKSKPINKAQIEGMLKLAGNNKQLCNEVLTNMGFTKFDDIKMKDYADICKAINDAVKEKYKVNI